MLFSIITVTFNNLEGLRRTAESVNAQCFTDYEWIVIDGGSIDGTAEWLPASAARWTSERDNGIYDAMNKGIEKAKGDYLLFLNAGDCLAAPDVLEKLALYEGTDFIYGDAWEDGHYKMARSHKKILSGMFTHHQSMLYRHACLGGLRYDTSYAIAADYKFTMQFLEKAKSAIQASFPVCRFEPGGISQRRVLLGRKEQFRARREAGLPSGKNTGIFMKQSLAWLLRRLFPRLYWRLKTSP